MMNEKQSAPKKQLGGFRPGSGRKAGVTSKLTAKELLAQCEAVVGKPFAVSIMEGYRNSILDGDYKVRTTYEKMILEKVATTMFDIEVEDTSNTVENKRQAFLEAVASLNLINKDKENPDATD